MKILLAFSVVFFLAKNTCTEPLFKTIIKPLTPSEPYTHKEHINEDNPDQYVMFWKLLPNDEIQFEIHCKTTGWCGLGISANGGMKDSDIALGWYDNTKGKAYLADCHATKNGAPEMDKEQNWDLLDGAEIDGYTILKYKRKLFTCDKENDREIKIGTTFMIFAMNGLDPSCATFDWKYHTTNRWTRSVLLLSFKEDNLEQQGLLPDDTFKVDLRMKNVKIAPKSTFYYCDFFKLPQIDEKIQLIQFEMLVNKNNKNLVHHVVAYECNDNFVPNLDKGQECGSVGLPSSIQANCQSKVFLGWGVGAQLNYSFPKEAGYPLELKSKTKYVMLELHYDNPNLLNDRYDDSGVSLYLTRTLRQYDLGMLILGIDGTPFSIQLPGLVKDLNIETICHPDCTNSFIPTEGINVVSGFLHTHLAGKSIKTSVVRNGKVIKYLFDNPNYDFNYQYILDIEPTKIYKGDALITTCVYDTTDRTKFTTFGHSTHDEMCYNYVYYYPKMPSFDMCFSGISRSLWLNFYDYLMKNSLIPTVPIQWNNEYGSIANIISVIQNNDSTQLGQIFKDFYAYEYNNTIYCGSGNSQTNIYKENIARYIPTENVIKEKECDPKKYDDSKC